ncbi:DUF3179 domain-containing protein [Roseovarius pelagicus]|uniref:DUF3179 domain-containing protein n=1 Tax=Roseovarius pelagicus TaxID=2980108 RepID=A0ABY6D7K0_9RHOB|nr:DUF3179 domain-containing protein [Roseovarius pelagicus]UXX82105.1 DUF3179 domain-containing protein [Roseovarius pelagicus]
MSRLLIFLTALIVSAGTSHASPDFWKHEWPDTNFDKSAIASWTEIMDGGPPKDGIPAIHDPEFHNVADETRIKPTEPVITLEIAGSSPRAYPVRYLMWHEIVNDTVGGVPVAVTFCPLCNSGITFDRRIDKGTLSFGVSGKLRNSDMIMYDRETQSWWQQAIGTALVGDLMGTKLKALPSWMESWAQYKARNPDGLVMSEPGSGRQYGRNPYLGYDSLKRPFLYNGENPPHGIPPLVRVVRVKDRAWTLARIRDEGTINEANVTLSWEAGQSSALDAGVIAHGKDVGTVRVRDADGRDLPHDVMFAFAYHAFWPDGQWMLAR